MFLAGILVLLLFVMSSAAQGSQEDLEWPPQVPIRRVPAWASLLRRAVVRLEEHLTSSWRPPLSRIQRDQAQYVVAQLSKAAAVLRGETERSRLDWLRTEHPRSAVAGVIWLAGTIGLAVASIYLLMSMEHAGNLFDLSSLTFVNLPIPTLVVAPALCIGTMDLWFHYQRRESNWLATEIEAGLRDRILPYLPPHA